jgi:hypothetical protein
MSLSTAPSLSTRISDKLTSHTIEEKGMYDLQLIKHGISLDLYPFFDNLGTNKYPPLHHLSFAQKTRP